jgi:hypothetical protein
MITWRREDEIGLVVHGPEVVDSGRALQVLSYLGSLGRVTAVLGGTMGRVAVLDAGLEGIIDISRRRRPSQSVRDLQASDWVVLLNLAKSRETGLAFGAMVAARAMPSKPLIQVDFGGGFVLQLAGEKSEMALVLAGGLGLELLARPEPERAVARERGLVRRRLTGVLPGEKITVNGTVVAEATGSSVEILASDGRIVEVRGAKLKEHGVEKLPRLDLEEAILRSGDIRRSEGSPRFFQRKGEGIALIDHCAEDAFEAAAGAGAVVTIGDDTTVIAGEILARLGIPVVGIVDGDLDGLASKTAMPEGSLVIRVRPGCDDAVGGRIKEEIFKDRGRIYLSLEDLAERVMRIASDLVVSPSREPDRPESGDGDPRMRILVDQENPGE